MMQVSTTGGIMAASATQTTNHILNVIRGVAALLVVISHARSYYFDAIGAQPSGWQQILLAPTAFAAEAVAVFFVLSGYLVGGQVLRQVRDDRFSWRVYLAKRLSRMWVVLIPAIILTLIVDSISARLFPAAFDAIRSPGELGPLAAACNAAFLQSTRCHAYGSNDALWSLSFEFWFYVLFAAGTVAVFAGMRGQWQKFMVGAALMVGAVVVFGLPIFRLIFAWLVGVGVALVHERWKEHGAPAWAASKVGVSASVVVALVGIAGSKALIDSYELHFAVVGLAVAPGLLLAAAHTKPSGKLVTTVGTSGEWSFSMYAYHLPILKLLISGIAGFGSMGALNLAMVYMLGATVGAACIPLWFITEKRTPLVRNWMLRAAKAPAPVR